MSFRRRMVLLAAGAVAAAIVMASAVVYVVTRNELHIRSTRACERRSRPVCHRLSGCAPSLTRISSRR